MSVASIEDVPVMYIADPVTEFAIKLAPSTTTSVSSTYAPYAPPVSIAPPSRVRAPPYCSTDALNPDTDVPSRVISSFEPTTLTPTDVNPPLEPVVTVTVPHIVVGWLLQWYS